jgi:RNA polymerase sigma factor (sigma-70 family)
MSTTVEGDDSQITVSDLISRCVQGDENAWSIFVSRYARRISLYVVRAYPGQPTAESVRDLSQEVFVKLLADDMAAIRRLRTITEEGLLAFLASVAHSVVVDEMRRLRSAKRAAQVIPLEDVDRDPSAFPEIQAPASPEFELAEKLEVERFQAILRSVLTGPNAERDALIVQMYFLDGMSAAEIARVRGFGLSVSLVEGVIHRVRKLLREKRENFV